MKKKLLIASILLLASTSVLAATGHGYRIIKEELHAAPGSNFHVEEVTLGTTALMGKKSFEIAKTTTVVANAIIKLGQIGQLDGYHHISIENPSTVSKTIFVYQIKLDCMQAHSSYDRYIELEPGGTYKTDNHSYAAIQGGVIGNYPILGSTSVSAGTTFDISNGVGYLYVIN
jgi:hypothetical protein